MYLVRTAGEYQVWEVDVRCPRNSEDLAVMCLQLCGGFCSITSIPAVIICQCSVVAHTSCTRGDSHHKLFVVADACKRVVFGGMPVDILTGISVR